MSDFIDLARIVPSRYQPRGVSFDEEALWELACSIEQAGGQPVEPVVVRDAEVGKPYELIAGERRVRAMVGLALGGPACRLPTRGRRVLGAGRRNKKQFVAHLAREGLTGLTEAERQALQGYQVKAEILQGVAEEQVQRMVVIDALQHEMLTPIEEARALAGLGEGLTQREVAKIVGKSQSWVAQRLALLGLDEGAQAAVSTRVLTATHARALAQVPEALQDKVTAHVLERVSKDDSPATTRQVQKLTREVAAFVDPAHWSPNGGAVDADAVLTPEVRNRLLMMQWLVGQADLAACGKGLLDLQKIGYNHENMLGKGPERIVERASDLDFAVEALGYGGTRAAWKAFAEASGRGCKACIFWPHRKDKELGEGRGGYCALWCGVDLTSCDDMIAEGDPVVIPLLHYGEVERAEALGLTMAEEPFEYVSSLEDYLAIRRALAVEERKEEEEHKREKERGHVDKIAAFFAFQNAQQSGVLEHFQAHVCARCANFRNQGDDPPCRWVSEALGHSYDKRAMAAPDFHIFVRQDGAMLPRCAQFSYAQLPALLVLEGVAFGAGKAARKRALGWLRWLAAGGSARSGVCAALRWLNYGRPPLQVTDYDRMMSFLLKHWDELGGDGAIAGLFEVVMSEKQTGRQMGSVVSLLNPTTGEVEEFAVADFDTVVKGESPGRWASWPKGYPQPWVTGKGDDQASGEN